MRHWQRACQLRTAKPQVYNNIIESLLTNVFFKKKKNLQLQFLTLIVVLGKHTF